MQVLRRGSSDVHAKTPQAIWREETERSINEMWKLITWLNKIDREPMKNIRVILGMVIKFISIL